MIRLLPNHFLFPDLSKVYFCKGMEVKNEERERVHFPFATRVYWDSAHPVIPTTHNTKTPQNLVNTMIYRVFRFLIHSKKPLNLVQNHIKCALIGTLFKRCEY